MTLTINNDINMKEINMGAVATIVATTTIFLITVYLNVII